MAWANHNGSEAAESQRQAAHPLYVQNSTEELKRQAALVWNLCVVNANELRLNEPLEAQTFNGMV